MNLKRHLYFKIMILCIFGLLSGCAISGKYGKLYTTSSGMTIEHMKENWKDYHVYWIGASSTLPYGIVFDPKFDDRKLEFHDWWQPVKTEVELAGITDLLKFFPDNLQIRDILSPDKKELFGYIYTYDSYALRLIVKKVDENTMWIDQIP